MIRIRTALAQFAQEVPWLRATLMPVLRQADKWQSMPKGWTEESRQKFWESLTGDNKHKVTKCIEEMEGKNIDDPGAFCASLADQVMGPEWRSKKAMRLEGIMTSALPPVLKRVFAEVRVPAKRKINVRIDNSFSMYSAGDDGAKGFTALVDIDTGQYSVIWGAFGGGALGMKPNPVDDVNTPKKALQDHLVIVQGQVGGRDPYASMVMTDKTYVRLLGVGRRANGDMLQYFADNPDKLAEKLKRDKKANDASTFINTKKIARADVTPLRQRSQYSCMAASMTMCLKALGYDTDEDQVNRVMGAQPMRGAAWEQALACAQYFGCRATLTMPATVEQLKAWTDASVPVMIAWNPEGRPWSHASVVFDVDADLNVYVADPNIPNPKETIRVVPEAEFYEKWYEKFPDYLVRRPACAIEREITVDGKQMNILAGEANNPTAVKLLASRTASLRTWDDPHKSPLGVSYPKSKWDKLGRAAPFRWATPATNIDGSFPEPWRVTDKDAALIFLKKMFPREADLYTDYETDLFRGHNRIWIGLRDNRDKQAHYTRLRLMFDNLNKTGWPVLRDNRRNALWLFDDVPKDVLRGKHAAEDREAVLIEKLMATYSGNPGGKPIYDIEIDHGEDQALSGGHDVMKRLQDQYRIEQGHEPRSPNPRLARWNANTPEEVGSVERLARRFLAAGDLE